MQRSQSDPTEISAQVCAKELVICVPTVMQHLRIISQRERARSLSIQQFRALGVVSHRGGISMTGLAEQLGLAVPSTSRLVEGLVQRGYLDRTPIPSNRRQLNLTMSPAGDEILAHTVEETHRLLAERLAVLSEDERATVIAAMRLLTPLFDIAQIIGGPTNDTAVSTASEADGDALAHV